MKQIKFLGMAIMALLALTGIISATASAEGTVPNILPLATAAAPLTGTSSSGSSSFGNGVLKVTSKVSKGTLTGNGTKLGTFDVLFETSTDTLARKCTGLDDTAKSGSILALGTFHIRDFNETGSLLTAVIFLLKEVHFECGEGGGATNVNVRGCVAGALTPENTLAKELTATLAEGKAGDNLIITVLNELNNATEACQLLASENGGAFKLSVEVTTQKLANFKQNGKATEVLVMRL